MTVDDRTRDRIRWHCRRGMLELDLTLNAFLERHFAGLGRSELDAFVRLLECPDPVLLDFVMGHDAPEDAVERTVMALIRSIPVGQTQSLTPAPSPARSGEVRGANG